MDYDVIVVGAGPAGSAAAAFLAEAGRRVLLLERHRFPRPKLCGDCLTPRAVRVLEALGVADELAEHAFSIRGCRIYSSRGGATETLFPRVRDFPDYGLVLRRDILDHTLARRAADAGADLCEDCRVTEVLVEEGRVVGVRWVPEAGDETHEESARVVVGADGAHSLVARSVFHYGSERVRAVGVAFRAYYEDVAAFGDFMEIYGEDTILPGVGWVFPLGGGVVNAGVGIYMSDFRQRGQSLEELMRGFLHLSPLVSSRLAGARQTGRVQGARLLMGGYTRGLVRPGVLLVGDAAGLVNPLTGEGMMYALESGRLAAETIDRTLAADDVRLDGLHHYQREIDRRLGRYFAVGTRFIHLAKRPWAVNLGLRVLTRSDFLAGLNLRFWVSQF